MPVVALEGSVIAGRSIGEAERSGFLGFQERLFEESIVAFFWLYGIRMMSNGYNKLIPRLPFIPDSWKYTDFSVRWPDTKVGWFAKGNKRRSLDLTEFQWYSVNTKEVIRSMAVKSTGLLLSAVGITVGVIGLLIPWLNKKKTEWILKNFYQGEHKQTKKQAGQPIQLSQNTTRQGLNRPNKQINQSLAPSGIYPYQYPPGLSLPIPLGFGTNSSFNLEKSPRFGFTGQALAKGIGSVGHAVDQTTYGSLLTADLGVTGGRVYSYGQRDFYDGLEHLIKDSYALVMYILAVPFMVNRIFNPLAKKHANTQVQLEPNVAQYLNRQIMNRLNGVPTSAKELRRILLGYGKTEKLAAAESLLKVRLRAASSDKFFELLKYEINSYLGKPLPPAVFEELKQIMAPDSVQNLVHARDVSRALDALQNPQGLLKQVLKGQVPLDLTTAIQQAFRHSVGLNLAGLEKIMTHDIQQIPPEVTGRILDRAKTMAAQHSIKLQNSAYRRILNLAKASLNFHYPPSTRPEVLNSWLMKLKDTAPGKYHAAQKLIQAERLSHWLEKAAYRHIGIKTLVSQELSDLLNDATHWNQSGWKRFGRAPIDHRVIKQLQVWNEQLEKAGTLRIDVDKLQEITGLLKKNSSGWLVKFADRLERFEFVLKDGVPSEDGLKAQLQKTVRGLIATVDEHGQTPGNRELFHQYRVLLKELSHPESHRLMSLDLGHYSGGILDRKVSELLQDGIVRESEHLMEGLRQLGVLPDDARGYLSEKKVQDMQQQIRGYLDTVINAVKEEFGHTEKIKPEQLTRILTDRLKKARGARMLAYGAAMGVASIGLGVVGPYLQFLSTRLLTGHYRHPGIAAAKESLNVDGQGAFQSTNLAPQDNYLPLHRAYEQYLNPAN